MIKKETAAIFAAESYFRESRYSWQVEIPNSPASASLECQQNKRKYLEL
jgi:hypothetical protein